MSCPQRHIGHGAKDDRMNPMTIVRLLPTLFLIVIAALPSGANAESVMWQTSAVPTLFYPASGDASGGGVAYAFLRNTQVTVQYRATIVDDLGNNLCGATVPKGTAMHLKFLPHESHDIYWFGTGYDHDSPYGFWKADAAPPTPRNGGYDPAWCTPDSYVNTFGWESQGAGRVMRNESHVSLDANPPVHTLSVPDFLTCDTPLSDGSQNCTASRAGSGSARFGFGATYGRFYFAIQWDPYWGSVCSPAGVGLSCPHPYTGRYNLYMDDTCSTAENIFDLTVPAQTIACPITVVEAQGAAPTTPTISLASGSGCVAGSPYTVRMTATDPDGDKLRFLVDWNSDGIVDVLMPTTGYVASGTTLEASRVFALPGKKKVQVKAQDEKGLVSGWATATVVCAADAASATLSGDADLPWWDNGLGGVSGATVSPDLQLRANPSLVHPGDTVKVSWSALHVSACVTTGSNGDSWRAIESALGGNVSAPIIQSTIYTLSCVDLQGGTIEKNVTVNILPNWREQ